MGTVEASPSVKAARAGAAPAAGRLMSLDVFRGATIAAMMLVNNPGDGGHVYAPLDHAEWHGWTFTDTVFPFFLWIVGVAMTLSFAKRVERGENRQRLLLHILKRAAIIFAIGLLLNGFPYYNLGRIRIPGVLQRIAVCYLFAGLIFLYTRVRGQVIAIVALLASYWMLMTLVPVPGLGPGHLEKGQNFAAYVDQMFLTGHMWSHTKTWDPEGIVSTLPSIATALFGVLAGWILRVRRPPAEKAAWLFLGGNLLIITGVVMNVWMPINKSIWTSTFSVFMAGLASVVFAICYWLVDQQGWRRWTKPFAIYGMNAIAVFILSGLIGRLLGLIKIDGVSLGKIIYSNVFQPIPDPFIASVTYALANVLVLYLIAWFLYRRNWFLKF